jgi:hypothetical protein
MPTDLRSAIQQLTEDFSHSLIEAVRGSSIEDLLAEKPARQPRAAATNGNGRLARRTDEDIAAMVDKIAGLLAKHKDGLRAEQIREELGVQPKELPRPLADAIKARRITSKGKKRATTYFAAKRPAKAKAKKK